MCDYLTLPVANRCTNNAKICQYELKWNMIYSRASMENFADIFGPQIAHSERKDSKILV